jgi:hypothetical protein
MLAKQTTATFADTVDVMQFAAVVAASFTRPVSRMTRRPSRLARLNAKRAKPMTPNKLQKVAVAVAL